MDPQLINLNTLFPNPESQAKIKQYINQQIQDFFTKLKITNYQEVPQANQIFEQTFAKEGIYKRYNDIFPIESLLTPNQKQYIPCLNTTITPHQSPNGRYYGTMNIADIEMIYYIRFTIEELLAQIKSPST